MFSFSALRNPNARRVVLSQMFSQICDKLMIVAMMWVIADKISPSWLPWYVVAGGLPHLLMAGWSGKLIARLKLLPTIIGSELFRAVVLLLFPLVSSLETPPIHMILILTFLINIGSALFNPAILSLPLLISDEEGRPQLNAMIDACFSLANVFGPVLSVILFAHLGLGGLILLNGVSYLVAAVLQWRVKVPASSIDEESATNQLAPSIQSVFTKQPLLKHMLISFLGINLFAAPFLMFFPLYVKQVYGLDIKALATLETCFGIGAVLGAASITVLHFSDKLGPKIIAAVLTVGVSLLVFAMSRTLPIGSLALVVMGFSLSLANVWILTLFQSIVPPDDVPTLMGIVNIVTVAATPVSLAITGLVIDQFDITTLATIAAAAFLIVATGLPFIPRLKEV